VTVSKMDSLGASGEYEFAVWLRKSPALFVVKAKYYIDEQNKDEKNSVEIKVSSGAAINVPELELVPPAFRQRGSEKVVAS
jgi:hypothetical protein